MGVAWITDVYQNAEKPIYIKSNDDRHNGVIGEQNLEDRIWHRFNSAHYTASWCGVPWFYINESTHYKIISLDPKDETQMSGVRLYTSIYNGQDSICYVDQRGKTFASTAVTNGYDTNCKLVFDKKGGFYIEPINTGNPDPFTILNAAGEVVKATIDMVLKVTELALSVAASEESEIPVELDLISQGRLDLISQGRS